MAPIAAAVFATLLMNDAYLPGAMVLGHSLRDRGAKGKLVALVTVDNLTAATMAELKTVYDDIVPVNQIVNRTPTNLYVMNRIDLISTFTKIELWRQTQYSHIVYIDADVVALRAPNELLTLETGFAAVPDIGWPDCFNSGVMVLKPNVGDYYSLLALAQRGISFDGGDQGLLNMHFRNWERLSFAYNCTPSGNYQYTPAYRHFQSSISMIHFIGRDKPWTLGRENQHSSGVYGELLGMWWAVYDKHYRLPKTEYYSGQNRDGAKRVQDYVKGEETVYLPGYSAESPSTEKPSAVSASTEGPLTDYPAPVEQLERGSFAPTTTAEQRKFSAPQAEWEPGRASPPIKSKPEASNFPTQTYDMSSDTALFRPPSEYPAPPKDMYYQVPEKAPVPARPNPIFPWEAHAPKPTRVFPPEVPLPAVPVPARETDAHTETPSVATGLSQTREESPATPTVRSPDPWQAFQRGNAWDEVPEIEQYVQAFNQSRKGKIQVIHHTPPHEDDDPAPVQSGSADQPRRPSVKLTDFPTEIERPSLPVTPAPIRRPSFWGEERDELGELPAAEGVPKQEEWNPTVKLDELQRRQSEVLQSGPQLEAKELPSRDMPGSSSAATAAAPAEKTQTPSKTPVVPKPILKGPHFERSNESDAALASPEYDPHDPHDPPALPAESSAESSTTESTSTAPNWQTVQT